MCPDEKNITSTDPASYPLVSIGIPTYNSRGKIANALQSIWQQQYPNIEIIVSDNCSDDNTEQLCACIGKDHNLFIRYYRQQRNIGLMPNFEFVLKQAAGEFFMWVADDDTLEPGILKKYVNFLLTHPEHSLVSGQILYWLGNRAIFSERNFNMEQNSRSLRVVQYYFKVVHGAMYYGLMRRRIAEKIPLQNRIGDDWHFVAALAYLGKVKNLDCVGYNKKLGGLSSSFKRYAEIIEATWFSADFPRVKIAIDAFSDILLRSPAYKNMPVYSKFLLALTSSAGILVKYYLKEYPFIIGGRIKRFFRRTGEASWRKLEKVKEYAAHMKMQR